QRPRLPQGCHEGEHVNRVHFVPMPAVAVAMPERTACGIGVDADFSDRTTLVFGDLKLWDSNHWGRGRCCTCVRASAYLPRLIELLAARTSLDGAGTVEGK